MDNLPPGMNPRELDQPEVSLTSDEAIIKYALQVHCGLDEELVYKGEFHSEEALQEEGLRKAEHAVEEYQNAVLDRKLDEDDYDDLDD